MSNTYAYNAITRKLDLVSFFMSNTYAYNAITGKLDLVSVAAPAAGTQLLLESGDALLLENGTDAVLLET